MCDYPGIIPQEGKSVLGVYVTGLDDGNMSNLDAFEGSQYRREKVKVKLLDEASGTENGRMEGREVEAETYVFLDKEDLVNEEWSYDEFVKEKIHRWIYTSDEHNGKFAETEDKINLTSHAEVDKARELNGFDPTGGRSMNGEVNSNHSVNKVDGILESAV